MEEVDTTAREELILLLPEGPFSEEKSDKESLAGFCGIRP
jgi:hypothetical protein